MSKPSPNLFDELVARGIVSPHDQDVRAQIARAERIAAVATGAFSVLGRLRTLLRGNAGRVTPDTANQDQPSRRAA